jgi:hypothetical protein
MFFVLKMTFYQQKIMFWLSKINLYRLCIQYSPIKIGLFSYYTDESAQVIGITPKAFGLF